MWAWPVLQVGLTSGGIFVPLLLSSDGSPVPASGGATAPNQVTQITAEQAIQAAVQGTLGVNIKGTTASGSTTSTSTNRGIEGPITVSAGAISFEMILSSDFVGTINGATVDNTSTLVVGVFRLDAPPWKPLAAVVYTITAGSAVRTIQT